jgi:hypothetical protein
MATPKLFFGTRNANAMLEVGRGYLDRGEDYALSAKTNKYAPAGAGGECIFTSLWAVFTFTATMVVYVTPIVDEVALERQTVNLVQNALYTRHSEIVELGLSVPITVAAVERGRVSPRGTWFQALVETEDVEVQLIVDGLEVEYEVVREGRMPQ